MNGSWVVSILAAVTVTTGLSLVASRLARRSRAALRHVLLAASFAVLAMLPIAMLVVPSIPVRVPIAATSGTMAPAVELITADSSPAGPATAVTSRPLPSASRVFPLPSLRTLLLAAWLAGSAGFLLPVILGLQQIRALRRSALPWRQGEPIVTRLTSELAVGQRVEVLLHEVVASPMTSGVLRPTIVLPVDAEQWPVENLERAIIHELEHVRRRDWLSQCLARVTCAGYWFHPLVWIARQQLQLEAERACDDAVLERAEATGYADQLVELAKRLSTADRQPLLAMAKRRDLAARVHALLDGGLARGRAGGTVIAAACVVSAALAVTMSPWRVVAAGQTVSRSETGSSGQKFDVVSVRPCDPNAVPRLSGGGRGSPATASPGRFRIDCLNVHSLINWAYVGYANGRANPPSVGPAFDMMAGPDWIHTERFTIEATTDDTTPVAVMRGPMLQRVLEDRFKLKMRRETREVPVYELVVAKGGSKLTPFKPGTCVPWDFSANRQPPLEPGQRRCTAGTQMGSDGNWIQTVDAMTLDDWVAAFNTLVGGRYPLDRPIVNKTGITGLQTFRFVYSGRTEDLAGEIRSQLGLELRPARGSVDVLVIDHVERPTPDGPFPDPPARARGGR